MTKRLLAQLALVAVCIPAFQASAASSCPTGWEPAVGTVYDSWPKPNTTECCEKGGCKSAGRFHSLDAGPCKEGECANGAEFLDGHFSSCSNSTNSNNSEVPIGQNGKCCRFPESLVQRWSMAATWEEKPALFGKSVQVIVQGMPIPCRGCGHVTVNVNDTCSDKDCDGCCKRKTGNGKYPLIDIEKWPASWLLGFDPEPPRYILDVNTMYRPKSTGLRPGTPESDVMPLCYRIV